MDVKEMARLGGLARAKKYNKEERSAMSKLGGRGNTRAKREATQCACGLAWGHTGKHNHVEKQ